MMDGKIWDRQRYNTALKTSRPGSYINPLLQGAASVGGTDYDKNCL